MATASEIQRRLRHSFRLRRWLVAVNAQNSWTVAESADTADAVYQST